MVTVPPKLTRSISPSVGALLGVELPEGVLLGVELLSGALEGWEEGAEDGTEGSGDGAWEVLEPSEVVKEPSTGGSPAGLLEAGALEGALLAGRLETVLSGREDAGWELWGAEDAWELSALSSREDSSSEDSAEASEDSLLSGRGSMSRGVPPVLEGSAGSRTSTSLAQATEPTEKAADTASPAAVRMAAMTRR